MAPSCIGKHGSHESQKYNSHIIPRTQHSSPLPSSGSYILSVPSSVIFPEPSGSAIDVSFMVGHSSSVHSQYFDQQ